MELGSHQQSNALNNRPTKLKQSLQLAYTRKPMNKCLSKFLLALALLCQIDPILAREPYHATVTVDSTQAKVSAPNLVDLNRDLRSENIQRLIPFYTPVSPVSIAINLRGIDTLTSFAANSTVLVVEIPQAGITQTFEGGTREESLALFKDSVRDGGNKHRLFKAYPRFSPIDPIAGNPNSLMAQMAQADYLLGRLSPLSGCDCSWNAQPLVHQFQLGSYVTRGFSKGFDTTSVTLPSRYSYSPYYNWALVVDAPLTYNRNGGASSLFGSLGFGLRVPLASNWTLTPILRFGSGGTLDLCTAGCFFSTGITSEYNYKIREFVLAMTNYAGYITSVNLWLTGVNFNYHLQNYLFKNGVSLTTCKGVCLYGRPINFGLSFIDSYFGRGHLFIRHYDEIGASLIINYINPRLDYDSLTLGFSYQFGQKDYRGYCFSMAYQF